MPVFSFLLSIGIIFGLAYWLWKGTAENNILKYTFWPGLVLKLLCGILLGLLYYNGLDAGGDTWKYQRTADLLSSVAERDIQAYLDILLYNKFVDPNVLAAIRYPTYTNSFFFIKIVSILNFLTYRNYYLNSLYFSFFSFAGCWYLVLKLGNIFPGSLKAAIFALLFFPSVVFWNSGVIKDGILLGALCFFWVGALQLAFFPERNKWKIMLLILFSAVLLWKIKFFIAAFVFALTGSWFVLHMLYKRFWFFQRGYLRWLTIPFIIGFIIFLFSLLHYKFNLPFLLMSLVLNNQLFRGMSDGRPILDLTGLEPNLASVLWHTPEALGGVLFRPFIWEGNNHLYVLASLENLILLILVLGAFIGIRKLNLKQYPGFYLILLIYSLCLAAAFGLSTPNLGSLNRYRTAFLPFLIFLLLETPFWRQILNRLTSKFRR